MGLELSLNGTAGIELDFGRCGCAFLKQFDSQGRNPPLRSLVMSIPDYRAKPFLAAFIWK